MSHGAGYVISFVGIGCGMDTTSPSGSHLISGLWDDLFGTIYFWGGWRVTATSGLSVDGDRITSVLVWCRFKVWVLQERYQRSLPGLDTASVMPSDRICTALTFCRSVRPKTINLRLAFTVLNEKPLSGNASNYAKLYHGRSDQNRVVFRLLSFPRTTAEQPTPLW